MSRFAYGARRLGWTWNGTGIAATDFGVPLSATGYVLCLYDEAGGTPENVLAAVVPPGRCPGGPCWKDLGVGFKYRNEVASPAGIEALLLRAALDGTGRLRAKGKSAALALPALPLAQDPAVVLQLRRTDGPECWEARYTSPNRNDGATFSARSD